MIIPPSITQHLLKKRRNGAIASMIRSGGGGGDRDGHGSGDGGGFISLSPSYRS